MTLKKFFHSEYMTGVLLLAATIASLTIANTAYAPVFHHLLGTSILGLTVHEWVNDVLMAIFFFVMGMEIKKEVILGQLDSRQKAMLPVIAALGGMIVPAIVYYIFNRGTPASSGWGIPMATDIAFALGALSLLGRRVPLVIKVFLMALAVADDLGAVLVIAVFYTEKINVLALLGAATTLVVIFQLIKMRVHHWFIFLVLAVVMWLFIFNSGVHATIAGVILGLITPLTLVTPTGDRTLHPLHYFSRHLEPAIGFLIMPVFAFANAGISFDGVSLVNVLRDPVHWGVCLGLLLGKPVGILSACLLAIRLKFAELPYEVGWNHLSGLSLLAGIGFTMSLFVAVLGLAPEYQMTAKTGIFMGSILSATLGCSYLWFTTRKRQI